MTFGQWLTEKRESLRLRASDCARVAGITVQQWSDYEKDRSRRRDGMPTRPSVPTIKAIAKGLGIEEREVFEALMQNGIEYTPSSFTDSGNPTRESRSYSEDAEEVLSYYEGLPPSLQPGAKELLRGLFEQSRKMNEGPVIGRKADEE